MPPGQPSPPKVVELRVPLRSPASCKGVNPAGRGVELPAPPVNPGGRPRRTHFLFPFRAPANRSPKNSCHF